MGEILFQEDEAVSINELGVPMHGDRGKSQVILASHLEMEVERVGALQLEGEPNFDRMAQQVQNLFILMNFYDQVDFSNQKSY